MIKCLMFKIGLSMVNYVDCQVLYKEKQFCSDFRYAIGFLDKTGVMTSVLLWRERMNWKTKKKEILLCTLCETNWIKHTVGLGGANRCKNDLQIVWMLLVVASGNLLYRLCNALGPRQSQGPSAVTGAPAVTGTTHSERKNLLITFVMQQNQLNQVGHIA